MKINDMPRDRVTDKDGSWYLRQGYLDDNEEVYITVVSAKAPAGTLASDLVPEMIEISDSAPSHDPLELPVETLRELMQWP